MGSVEIEFRWVSIPQGQGDGGDRACAGMAELCLRFCSVVAARGWEGDCQLSPCRAFQQGSVT